MPANEPRPWPRPAVHAHVLGVVKLMMIGRTRVHALFLFEQSVERDQVPAETPVLRSRIIGDVDNVRCTICGRPVADWHLGEDALEALLERVLKPVV